MLAAAVVVAGALVAGGLLLSRDDERTSSGTAAPGELPLFGPVHVWSRLAEAVGSDDARGRQLVASLRACGFSDFRCTRDLMEREGASPAAISFFRHTHAFLIAFEDGGIVDLGVAFLPWQPRRPSSEYLVLNGSPTVIFASRGVGAPAIEGTSAEAELAPFFPAIQLDPETLYLEGREPWRDDGERVLFQAQLVAGCPGCRTPYAARVAYAFAEDATFLDVQLLEVCAIAGEPSLEERVDLERCPPLAAPVSPGAESVQSSGLTALLASRATRQAETDRPGEVRGIADVAVSPGGALCPAASATVVVEYTDAPSRGTFSFCLTDRGWRHSSGPDYGE